MLAGVKTTERVRLADYTTLRLGGTAGRFVEAGSEEALIEAVRGADAEPEPVLVLGGGSNLVVADDGYPGVVVLAACAGMHFTRAGDSVEVIAAAGQDWDELVQQCVGDGLSGVECLSGIPGRAGATPIQNVGAYGQDVAQTITRVRAYDRLADQVIVLTPAECQFGYRTSMFKRQAGVAAGSGRGGRGAALNPATATGRFVVLDVTFRLAASPLSGPVRYRELSRVLGVAEGGQVPLAEARAAVLDLRRAKGMVLDESDPDTRSAGSFFTNPIVTAAQHADMAVDMPHWPEQGDRVKLSAAWLIERSGFIRGHRLAGDPHGARISTKHTLALTNPDGADTRSLIRLAREIRDGVQAKFGVELVNEPMLVGVEL